MMSKTLLISEKPSVGKDLAKALGKQFKRSKDGSYLEASDYIISWSIGHLLSLAEPESYGQEYKRWRIEQLPILPEQFKLKPLSGNGKKQLKALSTLLNRDDVSEVINACDAGREGELIFAYLYQHSKSKKPVKRLWLSSLTAEAIDKAFRNLRDQSEMDSLEAAARSRAEADWLVGMNATRAASIRLRSAFASVVSLGRVQTPTLALLARREQEISSFKAESYWVVEALFDTDTEESYSAKYLHGKRLEKSEEAEAVVNQCHGRQGQVSKVEAKRFTEQPPLLFDLTSLQRQANNKFGYTAKRTLALTQRLYEHHKLLTYPRTNSRYLPDDLVPEIPKVVKQLNVIPEYKAAADHILQNSLRTDRAINSSKVGDHHAIIPTGKTASSLDSAEQKIYDLVCRQFLAAFNEDAHGLKTKVETIVAEHEFHSNGKVYEHLGWRVLYQSDKGDETILPPLSIRQQVTAIEVKSLAKETKPPRRFSDASLLGAMETAGKELDDEELRETMKESGIGTPATRAAIIERLLDVGYVEREGRSFIVTSKGVKVIELLKNHPLLSAQLTGEWERRLNLIEDQREQRDAFMGDIAGFTRQTVTELAQLQPPKFEREVLGPCPHCGKDVVENRKGYSCWSREDPGCGFVLWKTVSGKKLSQKVIKELYEYGETKEQVSGFKSKKGKSFRARLKITKNDQGKYVAVFNEDWAQQEQETLQLPT